MTARRAGPGRTVPLGTAGVAGYLASWTNGVDLSADFRLWRLGVLHSYRVDRP